MSNKKLKDALIIQEGDEITVEKGEQFYGQKSYVVLEVNDRVLTCRIDVKNPFGQKSYKFHKDELSDEMIEKYGYRNK